MEWNGIVCLGVDTSKVFNVWHIVNIPRFSHTKLVITLIHAREGDRNLVGISIGIWGMV
jgi:hypothetical protein